MGKDEFTSCAKESDIKEGRMKAVRVKGRPILLVRKGGQVFALSNRCPHMDYSLEKGILRDYMLMCPSHGWKFDIRNGQYEGNKDIALVTYPCKVQDGKVYIKLVDKV
jgi:3-phenylpropionate/trans-cinnamate dioxygenase ferredoxin subunit